MKNFRVSVMQIEIENEKFADFNTVVALDSAKVCVPEYHGMFKKKSTAVEYVPYPLENHIYMLKKEFRENIVGEILKLKKFGKKPPKFLSTFLKNSYGLSLYEMFFKPYYEKIFQTDLKNVLFADIENLFRKTTPKDILLSNFSRLDTLQNCPENFDIKTATELSEPKAVTEVSVKTDRNSYAAVLIPDAKLKTFRITCLGNLTDCSEKDYNAVVEIAGEVSRAEIDAELAALPLNPKYASHDYKNN